MTAFIKNALGLNLLSSSHDEELQKQLIHVLTLTAALCFIGHGAWGIITKSAWVPFFTSMGISETWAYRLMPLVGTMDIGLGLLLILRPMRIVIIWMMLWGLWTALLRPIAGQSMWEFWERGGNYGAPIALLLCYGAFVMSWKDLFSKLEPSTLSQQQVMNMEVFMRIFLACLLIGHGALAAFVQKDQFLTHFASIGINLDKGQLVYVGMFEITLGFLLGFKTRFWRHFLILILTWKLATEFLHVTSGPMANIFEWIERWGDYGIPIALLYIDHFRASQIRNF